MIQISGLTINFGSHYLFDNVSFVVNDTDRIGLIGRNGAGKSTLLKLIAGIEKSGDGKVIVPNDYTIGYLPQDANVSSDKSIFIEASEAMSELKKLEKRIDYLTVAVTGRDDYESKEYLKMLQELSDATHRWEYLGGSAIDAEIEKVLLGLGFNRSDFDRSYNEFSGGWQMRIELAKLLLRGPDCILLDEPTNHLDIESIRWLEKFLISYPGAVIIVSHDRRFLDNITNRTIEISRGKIYDQNMPYSEFIQFRIEQREHQLSQFKNQQRLIAQQEKFIERFRYKATLASRAQSRIKQLQKIKRIELDDPEIESISFQFPEAPRSSRLVYEAKGLSKSYGSNLVLDKIDFDIERGERVAFVGKNGEGKTTFSKILAGIEDYEGELNKGANIFLGYYAQHQSMLLDPNANVFEVIDAAAQGDIRKHIRSLLGAFLFSGEEIYKKVKVLSGGERSRLAICKLLLEPSNLLILDEPTNHLDMAAKDVLKEAILNFEGALIIVSHDRDFLEGLTDKTIEFSGGGIKEYPGDIDYYLQKRELDNLHELNLNQTKTEVKEEKVSATQLDREEKKRRQREENKIKKQIEKLEEDITSLELEITALEEFFSSEIYFSNPGEAHSKQADYSRLKEDLNAKMAEWEELNSQLDEI